MSDMHDNAALAELLPRELAPVAAAMDRLAAQDAAAADAGFEDRLAGHIDGALADRREALARRLGASPGRFRIAAAVGIGAAVLAAYFSLNSGPRRATEAPERTLWLAVNDPTLDDFSMLEQELELLTAELASFDELSDPGDWPDLLMLELGALQ